MCPVLTGVMEGGHIVNRPQIAEFKGYLQDDLLFLNAHFLETPSFFID